MICFPSTHVSAPGLPISGLHPCRSSTANARAQPISNQRRNATQVAFPDRQGPVCLLYDDWRGRQPLDERAAKVVIERTASDVDQVKRLSSRNRSRWTCKLKRFLAGSQSRQDLRRWLSPSDPSTNHNIACGPRHEGTAEWFFQRSIFREWKSTGDLLWIHGKRTLILSFQLYFR